MRLGWIWMRGKLQMSEKLNPAAKAKTHHPKRKTENIFLKNHWINIDLYLTRACVCMCVCVCEIACIECERFHCSCAVLLVQYGQLDVLVAAVQSVSIASCLIHSNIGDIVDVRHWTLAYLQVESEIHSHQKQASAHFFFVIFFSLKHIFCSTKI